MTSMATPRAGPHGRVGAHWAMSSSFVGLIVALERSFRALEIRWPRAVEALPGYAVGSLGAYWTIQRTLVLFGSLR